MFYKLSSIFLSQVEKVGARIGKLLIPFKSYSLFYPTA